MSEPPVVTLRARTDDDLDVLFAVAADLDTWEERNPQAPAPLTRERFDARRAADPGTDAVEFVVDVDGRAVGGVPLFGFDSFARHAEVGISLVPEARGAEFFHEAIGGQADQMEAFATATSTEDLVDRLERCGALTRIDRTRRQDAELRRWIRASRLDGFGELMARADRDDPAQLDVLTRLKQHAPAAVANLTCLVEARVRHP